MRHTLQGSVRSFGAIALGVVLAAALVAHHRGVAASRLAAAVIPYSLLGEEWAPLDRAGQDAQLRALVGRLPAPRHLALDLAGLTRDGVAELSRLRRLSYLELRGARGAALVPAVLAALEPLPGLRALAVGPLEGLTEWDLDGIGDLRALRSLRVGAVGVAMDVGDRLAEEVAGLRELRELHLTGTRITGYGLSRILGLRELRSLGLDGSPALGDEDLARLAELEQLTSLDLSRTLAAERTAEALASLRRLEWLRLDGSAFTDAAARRLAGHPALRTLDLAHTAVSEDAVASLEALPRLRDLDLSGCRGWSARGIEALGRLRGLESLRAPSSSTSGGVP